MLPQHELEAKWQAIWAEAIVGRPSPLELQDEVKEGEKPPRRFFCVDMFPYPSLGGFTVNQLRGMTITDVVARFQEALGKRVLRPIGWDAFGHPIEEEAERHGISPAAVVERGIELMRTQLRALGMRVDWESELRTSDPEFYRWTQWLFLKLHERGLAYRTETAEIDRSFYPETTDFAESLNVEAFPNKKPDKEPDDAKDAPATDGKGSPPQAEANGHERAKWMVKITEYSDRLDQGLRSLQWPGRVKRMQRNWIGRREGHRLVLKANNGMLGDFEEIEVFIRKVERIPGGTFLVLAPEHPVVDRICDPVYHDDVIEYREEVLRLSERERLSIRGVPEGRFTGATAINPVTLRAMPIWVSGFVLPDVRFGAIFGVPGQDDGHAEFARANRIPIVTVVGSRAQGGRRRDRRRKRSGGGRSEDPVMINCGPLSGVRVEEACRRIRADLQRRRILENHVDFHLRDWVFSRQHYWGEPIPVVYDQDGEVQLVNEEELPVALPQLKTTPAGGTLASIDDFVEIPGTDDQPPMRRETDIMPHWMASCWYYLRYLSPNSPDALFDGEKSGRWLPVDLCVGGIEHAVLHLLYVRFVAYFLKDLGVTRQEEPFRKLFSQGRIYRKAPPKDIKRIPTHRGDRIEASKYLQEYGGDALRLHLLFLGPPADDVVWSDAGLRGCRRFLRRANEVTLARKETGRFVSRRVLVEKHRMIRRVTRAIRTFRLNKAVSAFMEFVNFLRASDLTPDEVDRATLKTFTVLLAPFAPHLAAQLWEELEGEGSVSEQEWPTYSKELLKPLEPEFAIQVDSRLVDRVRLEEPLKRSELIELILARPRVARAVGGVTPDHCVVVPDHLVNIVLPRPAANTAPEPAATKEGQQQGPAAAESPTPPDATPSP